jgi:predicted ATPase
MATLDYITIQGFKSIASIEKLPLRPINVIVGPNGSGKSNFIGAFSFLHAIREGRLEKYVANAGGANKLLHFGSKVTSGIKIHVSFRNEAYQYEIDLETTELDAMAIERERVYRWDQKRSQHPYGFDLSPMAREAGISKSGNVPKFTLYVKDHLNRWRLYHFHDTSASSPMKKSADINDNRFLRSDASNIASFLYFLRERHEAEYAMIRSLVQRVAPFFDDFALEPLQLNPNTIRIEWKHLNSDLYFDASALSDGSLRFIALATLFMQPESLRPSVILVDEPELGQHPYAISMLASMIRQASRTTQVIISTQSPILLDYFEPEEVLVADRVHGGTVLTRLEPAPLAAWLEDYSLGQLWEKNEIGGRPKAEV